jgi:tRNA modification GTPase trmE
MYRYDQNDTIVAPATGMVESAIGVIRMSGDKALEIAEKFFVGKRKLSEATGHTLHYENGVVTGVCWTRWLCRV